MNKIKIYKTLMLMLLMPMVACMDDHEEPDAEQFSLTSSESIGEVNTTIYELKKRFAGVLTNNNTFERVDEDIIIEGIVCANDAGGNLYQTLIIRSIDNTKDASSDAHDQCISIGIKNTFISPYFPLGQRIKINLNGLYIGNYSRVPKIGQPYYTSAGNLRLGPMLLELCRTNVELVGKPDPNAPELVPIDFTTAQGTSWLEEKNNQTPYHTPMLATVRGTINEVQGAQSKLAATGALSGEKEPLPKIFAPNELYDAGYGVDRTLKLERSSRTVSIRTSTQNDCSFLRLPSDVRSYTGQLTYYDSWQLTFRSVEDVERYEELL